MLTTLTYLASTQTTAKAGLFESLGIDWKMLVLQSIAFLLLLWVLSKFVYPVLNKMIDAREAAIEESQKAAKAAQEDAARAEDSIKKLMQDAQKEAGQIVSTAKTEANTMVTTAEEKAKASAERIVADAQESITKEVAAAKKALHNETIDLVTMATKKVVGKAVDLKTDKKLIESALEKQ